MQAAAAPKAAAKGAKSQVRAQKGSASSQSRAGSGSHSCRGRDVQEEEGAGEMHTTCKSAAISQLERELAVSVNAPFQVG